MAEAAAAPPPPAAGEIAPQLRHRNRNKRTRPKPPRRHESDAEATAAAAPPPPPVRAVLPAPARMPARAPARAPALSPAKWKELFWRYYRYGMAPVPGNNEWENNRGNQAARIKNFIKKMAPVDITSVYLVVAGIIGFIFLVVSLINKFTPDRNGQGQQRGGPPQAPAARAPEGPPGPRRRRRRMRVQQDDSEGEEEMDEDDVLAQVQQPEGKIGAKKLKKLQEKAERKAAREDMEREREDRKKRAKEEEERRKKDEETEKQEEAARAEEERKQREERERQEHEEYLKLKEAFSVDEEGENDAEADLNSESLLQEFINYIKETKVVMLEDLAGHFKLKTQDVILRVQDLQASGDLTGVIDDRGKFIYITMDELEAVAKYIRQHGRVSITELAQSSNRLITLDPDLRKLQAAAESMIEELAVA